MEHDVHIYDGAAKETRKWWLWRGYGVGRESHIKVL
jgi:hypothetical protein